MDVEVTLRDRSRLRAKLVQDEPVALRTAYGVLNVPVAALRCIRRGERLSAEEQEVLDRHLKGLGADDFTVRQEAQNKIAALGASARSALKESLSSASAEARTRIESILKKIDERGGPSCQPLDSVKTELFEARGRLDAKTFKVAARFGTFEIRFDDIDRIQWLGYGELVRATLDVAKACTDWVDTGLNLERDEEVLTRCTGQINMQGNAISPQGSNKWGSAQFLMGTVIGRVGASGKEFQIAGGIKFTPEASGRLYAKIYIIHHMNRPDQLNNMQGQYDLVAATGPQIEELEREPDAAPTVPAPNGQ
jgi:hypothetical protein